MLDKVRVLTGNSNCVGLRSMFVGFDYSYGDEPSYDEESYLFRCHPIFGGISNADGVGSSGYAAGWAIH